MITKDQHNQKQPQETVSTQPKETETVFFKIEELLKEILKSSKQQFTGRLTIKTPQKQQWRLYFGMGRLLWGSGGKHPRRRWRRRLAHACGNENFKNHYSEESLRDGDQYECWDFHLLLALHKRKVVTADQVRAVMGGMVGEILFDLNFQGVALCTSKEAYPNETNHCGKQVFTCDWIPGKRPSRQMVVPPSWGIDTLMIVKSAMQDWHEWRNAGLTHISPDAAPRLLDLKQLEAKTSPGVYQTLVKIVTGNCTLRDLSVLMKMEPIKIARSLQPHVRQDLIALEAIADLSPASTDRDQEATPQQPPKRRRDDQGENLHSAVPSSVTKNGKERPLIAFIDDSEQSRQIMGNIITNGGYEFLGIGDSVQAIPILLERQPRLIFLDLMMPNINGYELCSQIRKISSLKDVPIIIVTGNDGIVDRMRSKVVGANHFISKPIDRSEVLTLALQHTQTH